MKGIILAILLLSCPTYAQDKPPTLAEIIEEAMRNNPQAFQWTQEDVNNLVEDLELRVIELERKVKELENRD